MMTVEAPAKVNLSLEIVRKREDGFHELNTIMVPILGLSDTLEFTESAEFSFSCDMEGVPTDECNLVVKAARLFEVAAQVKVRYHIFLKKKVPHGAGLGGGSSDAAFTLLTLNNLYDKPLGLDKLHMIAAELGSDVPFFLYQSPCRCTGRGDIIEVVDKVKSFALCLLKPDFEVSTPDAYKRWVDSQPLGGVPYEPQDGPYGEMVNDLERPVFEKYLFLAECKRWLLDQPEVRVAQMSGSGSTMIAILEDILQAEGLISRAKRELDPSLFTWHGLV